MITNLMKLWGAEAQANLSSTKWSDRKESLASLLQIIETSENILFDRCYGELFDDLKKIIKSDSNVNVISEAVKVITALALLFKKDYSGYIPAVAPGLIDRFKEKKAVLRDPLTKCVDVIVELIGLDKMLPAFQEAWKKPNAEVKCQVNLAIASGMKFYSGNNVPLAFINDAFPTLKKFASDAEPRVRESTLVVFGSIQRLIGVDALSGLIGPLRDDSAKMVKIENHAEKAAKEAAEVAARRNVSATSISHCDGGDINGNASVCTTAPSVSAIDPFELLPVIDVMKLLNPEFFNMIISKKWTDRRDCLEELNKLLNEHKRLNTNPKLYTELVTELKKIVEKDSNVNVVSLAAKALTGLVAGLRCACEPFVSAIASVVLMKFKEKKTLVRDALANLMDELTQWVKIEVFGEQINTALLCANPTVKKEACFFVYRTLLKHDSYSFSMTVVEPFRDSLFKCVNDPDGDVRGAAEKSIAALVRCVGRSYAETKLLSCITDDKVKMITKLYESLMVDHNEEATGPVRQMYGKRDKLDSMKTANRRTTPRPATVPTKSATGVVKRVQSAPVTKRTPVIPARTVEKQVVPDVRRPIRNTCSVRSSVVRIRSEVRNASTSTVTRSKSASRMTLNHAAVSIRDRTPVITDKIIPSTVARQPKRVIGQSDIISKAKREGSGIPLPRSMRY